MLLTFSGIEDGQMLIAGKMHALVGVARSHPLAKISLFPLPSFNGPLSFY